MRYFLNSFVEANVLNNDGFYFCLCAVVPMAVALRCFQCGQYTDGVGSITPCINYTAQQHLKECPGSEKHCIVSIKSPPSSDAFLILLNSLKQHSSLLEGIQSTMESSKKLLI